MQDLTFADGDSTGETTDGGGGGAIFDRGGRLTVINDRFVHNRCDSTGPDLGGAAIRALSQYHGDPVYVVDSTFTGGVCSNGGGLSSIGVSWVVLNTVMTGDEAVGRSQPGGLRHTRRWQRRRGDVVQFGQVTPTTGPDGRPRRTGAGPAW